MGLFDSLLPPPPSSSSSSTTEPSSSKSSKKSKSKSTPTPAVDTELDTLFSTYKTTEHVDSRKRKIEEFIANEGNDLIENNKGDDGGKGEVVQVEDKDHRRREKKPKTGKKDKRSTNKEAEEDEEDDQSDDEIIEKVSDSPLGRKQDAKTRREKRLEREAKTDDPAKLSRTVFVGNLPVSVTTSKKQLKAFKTHFSPSSTHKIESIRFRSIAFNDPSLNRKAGFITKSFHPLRSSVNGYIVYTTSEAAKDIVAKHNGMIWPIGVKPQSIYIDEVGEEFTESNNARHLRVDMATSSVHNDDNTVNHDTSKTVFIGNLPFDMETEVIWRYFDQVGTVSNVRLIRDKKTNIGKGFGYVSFTDRSSLNLALKLNNQEIPVSENPKNAVIEGGKFEDGRVCLAAVGVKRKLRVMRCVQENRMKELKTEGKRAEKQPTIVVKKQKGGKPIKTRLTTTTNAKKDDKDEEGTIRVVKFGKIYKKSVPVMKMGPDGNMVKVKKARWRNRDGGKKKDKVDAPGA